MRVVSLVPSWTETLIAAGVNVVGRTRYCIHPQLQVQKIPAIGGTKRMDLQKLHELQPDLVILDKEENPKSFIEELKIPYHATHVISLNTLEYELRQLAMIFKNSFLVNMADRVSQVINQPSLTKPDLSCLESEISEVDPEKPVYYIIWRDPWMCIGPQTFISDVLEKIGFKLLIAKEKSRYPVITIDEMKNAQCLFSTEPFPFLEKQEELRAMGLHGALIDGEKISWYGIRSLKYLEDVLSLKPF